MVLEIILDYVAPGLIDTIGVDLLSLAEKAVVAAVGVMGAVTFIEFLYEEMLQTQGMGVYVAISNKQWTSAYSTLNQAKKRLQTAKKFYNWFGWLAPMSWNVFKNYADATESQYAVYEGLINSKIGIPADPSADRKVFNVSTFEVSMKNGTTTVISELVANVTMPAPAPVAPVAPVAPTGKITKEDLFKEMKTFYSGRMYLSKKELTSILSKYDVSDIQIFIDEINSFYIGRNYLSKKEMIDLGKKYNLDVSGL